EKWIKNEINKDTYDRWYSVYKNEILNLKGAIERLGNDQSEAFSILEDNLNLLTDMRHVYTVSDTLQKREFVNRVFDSNMYYENGIYRTPTMLDLASHNHLKMKEKGLLIYEKKEGLLDEAPLSGERGIGLAPLAPDTNPKPSRIEPRPTLRFESDTATRLPVYFTHCYLH